MRHRDKINHLGRKYGHRKSMLANMASSLIINHHINTTLAKAKVLRTFVEPIITSSKDDIKYSNDKAGSDEKLQEYYKIKRRNVHRYAYALLRDKQAVKHLFEAVTPKIVDRNGGYTRILKTCNRLGDNAKMCYMELVDFNPNYSNAKNAPKAAATKSTRRSRKKTKPAETNTNTTTGTEETKAE